MNRILIISYFTEDELYKAEAVKLMKSMTKFRLDYHIKEIMSRGSWMDNTQYKATFIKECMDAYPDYSLVYVDVDAVFKSYPILFDEFDEDTILSVHKFNEYVGYLSGTIFIRNTPDTRKFVDDWIHLNKMGSHRIEQQAMGEVIKTSGIPITPLPSTYCHIFDSPHMANRGEPVIEHHQASRRVHDKEAKR